MVDTSSSMMEYIKKSKINNKLKEAVQTLDITPKRAKLQQAASYFAIL